MIPGFEAFLENQDRVIAEHGHVSVYVGGDDPDRTYTYTVGLNDVGWPELICMTLGPDSSYMILNEVVRKLRSSERMPVDQMIVTEALNFPIHLISAPNDPQSERFTMARERAIRIGKSPESVTGLQAVWPDPDGKYPWEVGYDHKNWPQKLLGPPPS